MVKAIIDISEDANYVINMVKAMHGLRTKSQAIEAMSSKYYEAYLDSLPIKKSYIKKMRKNKKEPKISYDSFEEFREDMRKRIKK